MIELKLRRRPFFLYPGGGFRYSEAKKKTGESETWGEALDAIRYPGGRKGLYDMGKKAGYTFDFDVTVTESMDSHRLYLWAVK